MSRKKLIIMPRIDNAGGDLSKQWFVYYSYRNPATDQMKRFKIYKSLGKEKSFEGRTEAAEKLCRELTDKLKNGWTPFEDPEVVYDDQLQYEHIAQVYGRQRASVKSWNYFANKWLESKKDGLEPDTVRDYASKFRTFQTWLQKYGYDQYDISELGNQIMLLFFQYLKNERKSSRITYNKYKRYLTNVFEMLVAEERITRNPVYNVPENRRVTDMTPRPIYDEDVEAFKQELMKDKQLWLAVNLEYYCYLRPGKEIRLMKIKQIDFARGTILIPKNISKTKSDKIVIIPRPLVKIMREDFHLHEYSRELYLFGKNSSPGESHLGKNNLRMRFNTIRDRLKMPLEYKFYSWKHTGNVRADIAGIPLNDRQNQNGHRYASTTEIYTRNKRGYTSESIRDDYPEL